MSKQFPKGITQRGQSYRVSVMVSGDRRTGTAPTLEEAVALRDELIQGIKVEREPDLLAWTLTEAFNHYCRSVLGPRCTKPQTIELYEKQVGRIVRLSGDDPVLEDFDDRKALDFGASMMDAGWAAGTRKNCVILMMAIIRHAKKMGKMRRELPDFPEIRLPSKKPKFFSIEQEEAIANYLEHIGDDDLHDLIRFLADTGLRVGLEAIPLKWESIDFNGSMIQVWEGKGGKNRAVPMTARLRTAAAALENLTSAVPVDLSERRATRERKQNIHLHNWCKAGADGAKYHHGINQQTQG